MRSLYLASIAGLFFLAACNSARKPSDTNFTNAINQYLAKQGEACTVLNRQFPLDVPKGEQKEQYGIGPKLAALEQAGLLRGSDTTAAVSGGPPAFAMDGSKSIPSSIGRSQSRWAHTLRLRSRTLTRLRTLQPGRNARRFSIRSPISKRR